MLRFYIFCLYKNFFYIKHVFFYNFYTTQPFLYKNSYIYKTCLFNIKHLLYKTNFFLCKNMFFYITIFVIYFVYIKNLNNNLHTHTHTHTHTQTYQTQ